MHSRLFLVKFFFNQSMFASEVKPGQTGLCQAHATGLSTGNLSALLPWAVRQATLISLAVFTLASNKNESVGWSRWCWRPYIQSECDSGILLWIRLVGWLEMSSTSAYSTLCQWFVFLSNTFTGCHLSLHWCSGETCWASRNSSNGVEEKWLPVNAICQRGKCNAKRMDSLVFSESSSPFSPPTIGIFILTETSLFHLLPPWSHLSTISFVQTRFFWLCHPRSFMSLNLPGCAPDVSTENLVGLYLSDFLGEMQCTVTGTA